MEEIGCLSIQELEVGFKFEVKGRRGKFFDEWKVTTRPHAGRSKRTNAELQAAGCSFPSDQSQGQAGIWERIGMQCNAMQCL